MRGSSPPCSISLEHAIVGSNVLVRQSGRKCTASNGISVCRGNTMPVLGKGLYIEVYQ